VGRCEIPSIGGLRSFVAAARHESFTRAATELELSQGAVSRHIRELERHLGVCLFERVRQRVVLTDAGKVYLAHVTKPLDDLAVATEKVVTFSERCVLNLAALPTFATRWLMSRLPEFQRCNPKVVIHLTTPLTVAEFAIANFDAAIFHTAPDWPGMITSRLLAMELVAVCSPELGIAKRAKLHSDFTKLPLLHMMGRPTRWAEWFAAAGVKLAQPLPGHTYQSFAMVAQAAAAGLGVALLPPYLVKEELAANILEIVGPRLPSMQLIYYLIVPEGRASSPVVKTFVEWLMMEAWTWSSKAQAESPFPVHADAALRESHSLSVSGRPMDR
jgi:LysR family glycine cleavage system transcriptional activator